MVMMFICFVFFLLRFGMLAVMHTSHLNQVQGIWMVQKTWDSL